MSAKTERLKALACKIKDFSINHGYSIPNVTLARTHEAGSGYLDTLKEKVRRERNQSSELGF